MTSLMDSVLLLSPLWMSTLIAGTTGVLIGCIDLRAASSAADLQFVAICGAAFCLAWLMAAIDAADPGGVRRTIDAHPAEESGSRVTSIESHMGERHGLPKAAPPDVWIIHGESFDFRLFQHPGGALALSLGRGRDATELFESHHLFSDRHRRALERHRLPAQSALLLAPPEPLYEELKRRVRAHFVREASAHNRRGRGGGGGGV